MKPCPFCAEQIPEEIEMCEVCRSPPKRKLTWWAIGLALCAGLVAILLLLLVARIFITASKPIPGADDDLTQTWQKPMTETTCDDWIERMTPHQRYVAAGDMWAALHRRYVPPAEAHRLSNALTAGCRPNEKAIREQDVSSFVIVMFLAGAK